MSVDLRTEVNDADNATGWAGDGAAPATTTLTGYFYEGTAAITTQHSNTDEHVWTTQTSGGGGTFSYNLSDATVYMLVKDNLVDTYANGGVQITLGDGTNDIGYDVAGNDAVGLPLTPFYNAFKLDVSEVVATPGSFNAYAGSEASLAQTAITRIGYGSLHLAKAQGNVANVLVDRISYIANGTAALRINGGTSGTPETMADVQGDDETNGWGMVNNPLGAQYGFFAPTEWGNPTATADAYFEATNEQWYWIGDNGGGRAIGAGNFPFRLVGNATDLISFKLTNVTIVNTGVRATFDLSDTNVDVVELTNVTFGGLAAITFPTVDASKFGASLTFNDCDQVDLQSFTLDGATFNGTTDANGAIIWDENTTDVQNQDNLRFNSDGTGHAIEIAPTGAGPFTYNIDGYVFDGYATQTGTAGNRIFYINPATTSANITINLTNSAAQNPADGGTQALSYETVGGYTGTVTINNTVTLTVTVEDSAGNPIEGARVRIEAASDGSLITQGTTNASGVYSDATYNYSSDVAVTTKVRLKGWRFFRTGGTITQNGISVGVTLSPNTIVDLP